MRSREQWKAIFANMGKGKEGKSLVKRAVIGAAVAAGAGLIAHKAKGTVLGKRALVTAAAAGAAATSAGAQAYQATLDKAHAAELQVKQKAAFAKQYSDWARTKAIGAVKNFPIESLTASAIDYPFTVAEGALASQIDKRVGRLEGLAAKRMGQFQVAVTNSASANARKKYMRAFGAPPAGDADAVREALASKQGLARQTEELTGPRKLRRTVEKAKWNKLVTDHWNAALRDGRQHFIPTPEERQMMLQKGGIPVTPANEQQLNKILFQSYIMGTNPDLIGDNRVRGL